MTIRSSYHKLNFIGTAVWLVTIWSAFTVQIEARRLYPIVLLAGYMGNQLHYRLDNAHMPPGCIKNTPYFKPLWLDSIAATMNSKCWFEAMRLNYSFKKKRSYPPKGVLVYPWRFGRTIGSEYIAPFPQKNRISLYFSYLINMLEHTGYTRNKNIASAAYDWRRAPHEQQHFFIYMRQLIEQLYMENDRTPVILLGHSMGGNFAYVFLRRMSRSWKRKYIKTMFALATPWGGNFKYMYTYLYGDDFSGNTLPAFREVERTYSSLSFLLPNKRIFGNEVLIQTPTFNFTASTMYEYFRRLDNPQAYLQWLDTRRTMDPFKHPDVDIVCIGGRGFNTMRKMVLTNDRSFFGGKKKKRNSKYKVPRKGRFPPPLPSDPIMTYRRPHHWHPYHRPPIAMQTLEPQNDWVASLLSMFSIALPSTLLFQPLPPSSNFMQIYRLRPIHGLYTYPAMPSIFSRHYLVPVISLRMTDSISTSESQLDLKSDSQLNHHRKQRRRFDASSNLFNSKARPHKLSKNEFRDRLFFQNYFLHQLQSNAIWSRFQSTPVLTRRQDNGKPTDRLSIYKINHGMNVDSKKGRYLYFSDGDGFVNIESFLGCLHWYDHPKHKFFFDIKRDSHLGLLRNVESVEYLVDVIMKIR